MRTRLALLGILFFGVTSCALGQKMEEVSGDANPFIRSIREVSAKSAGWFPELSAAEPGGSLVVASGDFNNSDITIIVEKSRLDELKPRVMDMVAKLDLPATVILVKRARVIGSFELEFNQYIHKAGNHSFSTIPLGAVVDEVRKWPLPAPLGIAISGSQYLDLTFHGEKVTTMKLLQPNEVSAFDVVNVSVDRQWYGQALLCLMDLFVALGYGFLLWRIFTVSFTRKSLFGWLFVPRTAGSTRKWFELDVMSTKRVCLYTIFNVALLFTPRAWTSDVDSWIPAHPLHLGPLLLFVFGVPFAVAVLFRILTRGTNPLGEKPAWFRQAFLFVVMPEILFWAFSQVELFAPIWLFAIPGPTISLIINIIGATSVFSIAVATWAFLRQRGSTLC